MEEIKQEKKLVEINNCMKIKYSLDFLPWTWERFVFLDLNTYYADSILKRNNVRIKFIGDYAKNNTDYIIVFCKVHRKDVKAFLDSMIELKSAMLICGHKDYLQICKDILGTIDSLRK